MNKEILQSSVLVTECLTITDFKVALFIRTSSWFLYIIFLGDLMFDGLIRI